MEHSDQEVLLDATKPRTVNLELQTVLEFNPNNTSDLRMVDAASDFHKALKKELTMNKDKFATGYEVEHIDRRHTDEVTQHVHTSGKRHKHKPKFVQFDAPPYKFTDLVKDTFEILTTYNDDSLIEVVNAIADEINKHSINISKLYKLSDTAQFRSIMSQTLKSLNQASPQDLRNKFNTIVYMIDMDLFSDRQKDFLNFINSLHGKESDTDFRSLINNLRQYGRKSANLSLPELIRNSITSLINNFFEHISKPTVFPFFNKKASIVFENINNTRGEITNSVSLDEIIINKERKNYNDWKVNDVIDLIEKNEVGEKVAELFETVKDKNKQKRLNLGKAELSEIEKKNVDTINNAKQRTISKLPSKKVSVLFSTVKEYNKNIKYIEKVSLLSDKLKQSIKENSLRFTKLNEDTKTKHSAKRKTTPMKENNNKKYKRIRNKITLRDSSPVNDIGVQRFRAVLSEEENFRKKLHIESSTDKIRTQRPISTKELQKTFDYALIASNEGLTVESFENVQQLRRINRNNTDTYQNKPTVLSQNATGGDILKRLTNLEKQLYIIKKQISKVNVKKIDTERDDTSVESESVKSDIEDKNGKTTKTVVIVSTIPKRTTLSYKNQTRVSDDEFDNEFNNNLENKVITSKSNDIFNSFDGNNKKYGNELKTTELSFPNMSDEVEETWEESKQDIEKSDLFKKITAEKRNNEEDKKILAAALKKMEKEVSAQK